MRKKRKHNHLYEGIKAGLEDALAFARGEADLSAYRVHIPEEIDVRAIRKKMGLKQHEFAARYGFNIARIRDWEQGRSCPDGALRAYLLVIAHKPEAVDEVLRVA